MVSANDQETSLEQALIIMAETDLSLLLGIRLQIHHYPASRSIDSMIFGNTWTISLKWKQAESSLIILISDNLFAKMFGHDERYRRTCEWEKEVGTYIKNFSKQFSLRLSFLFSQIWELDRTELRPGLDQYDIKAMWRVYYMSIGDRYISDLAVGIDSGVYRLWRKQWKQSRRLRKLVRPQFFPYLKSNLPIE